MYNVVNCAEPAQNLAGLKIIPINPNKGTYV
jgi:hypothetical protein